MSADDAVHLIKNGDTITVGGYASQNSPEEILMALSRRFQANKKPSNLTVIFGGAPGDGKEKGVNHFAFQGMIKRVIGSHYGQAPKIGALVAANKIEAYSLPLGSLSRMIRSAASKLPGHVTEVGFGTMADPKLGGGKMNRMTKEDLVEEIEAGPFFFFFFCESILDDGMRILSHANLWQVYGKKYLLYKAVPINVAIIRGTTADPMGNITMERESLYVDNLIQAMAARASGGIILAQVRAVIRESHAVSTRNLK